MIVAALQARMGSTRLPGKVLAAVNGRPMLAWQIARVARAQRIDRFCIATSTEPQDDAIAALADELGIDCHRGPSADVLERIWRAAEHYGADHVVRLTGDCPLSDPAIIDLMIATHLQDRNDLTTNAVERSFPDGLDVEVIRFDALTTAREGAQSAADREHVTALLYRDSSDFRVGAVHADPDHGDERWTVDFAEDLEFIRRVFSAFAGRETEFSWREVAELLAASPSLRAINAMHAVAEG